MLETALDSSEPLYVQIRDLLRNHIQTELEPGDYLPPELQLADEFNVNRHTIRRAIDELVQDGLLERYRGRGTVVLNVPIEYPLTKHSRHTQTLNAKGFSTSRELIKMELFPATDGIANRLEIPVKSDVLWLEAIRIVNQRRVAVSSQFVPQPWADEMLAHYDGGSVMKFLSEHCGLSLVRKYSLITAVMPEEKDALHLNISRRLPLLRIKTVQIDERTGIPAEYSVTRNRSDAIQLRIDPE